MGRQRARKGTGSIYGRGDRFVAQLTIAGTDGSQKRRTATFETRTEAEAWLLEQRTRRSEQAGPVSDQTVADYLRWWIDTEAPKGKPGRAPLAETTLTSYRSNIELHARHGGGVGVEPPPVDWFSEDELRLILKAAQGEHFHAIVVLFAGPGCASVTRADCAGATWSSTATGRGSASCGSSTSGRGSRGRSRRPPGAPCRSVWRSWMCSRSGERSRTSGARVSSPCGPTSTAPSSRRAPDCRSRSATSRAPSPATSNVPGVDHGTLKTLRSTVATQLAEAGVHPKKAQAFLGHAHMSTTMKYYTAVGDISDLAVSLPDL